MVTDNEHTLLRRRIEKRLGRAISRAAWDVAVERRYVADALEAAHDTAEEDLATYLSDLLRVQDATGRAARQESPTSADGPKSGYLTARNQAVSRLAAEDAAGDAEILAFRRRVVGRDSPMGAGEAEAFLARPEARHSPGSTPWSDGPSELLNYQNARINHTIHVWPGSPLDDLRKFADRLCESYPWQPAQAAAFVLEGVIPRATPFTLRFRQPLHEGRPRRAKLVMEVDLWMPAAHVARAYRDLQRRVLPGHNRPISRRSVDLVNFVLRHRPASWPDLLELWNNEHPNANYADYRRMRFAYIRAAGSLIYPRYRTYLGPDS